MVHCTFIITYMYTLSPSLTLISSITLPHMHLSLHHTPTHAPIPPSHSHTCTYPSITLPHMHLSLHHTPTHAPIPPSHSYIHTHLTYLIGYLIPLVTNAVYNWLAYLNMLLSNQWLSVFVWYVCTCDVCMRGMCECVYEYININCVLNLFMCVC